MAMAMQSNVVLLPRTGPKPLVVAGLLLAAAGMAWLTRLGLHSSYVSAVLGPLLVTGAGTGLALSRAHRSQEGVAGGHGNTGRHPAGEAAPNSRVCARRGAEARKGESQIFGRESVGSASGPASPVLWWCGRRAGGLGPGLTSESADAARVVLRNDLPAGPRFLWHPPALPV